MSPKTCCDVEVKVTAFSHAKEERAIAASGEWGAHYKEVKRTLKNLLCCVKYNG